MWQKYLAKDPTLGGLSVGLGLAQAQCLRFGKKMEARHAEIEVLLQVATPLLCTVLMS